MRVIAEHCRGVFWRVECGVDTWRMQSTPSLTRIAYSRIDVNTDNRTVTVHVISSPTFIYKLCSTAYVGGPVARCKRPQRFVWQVITAMSAKAVPSRAMLRLLHRAEIYLV